MKKRLLFHCINKSYHNAKIVYKLGLCFAHLVSFILSEKEIEHNMYVGKKGISTEVGVVYDTLKWKAEFF